MIDQRPNTAGGPMQLEAPASLQGFLTEPGRQSSDGLLQLGDAAAAAAADQQAGARPLATEQMPLEEFSGDATRLQVNRSVDC